MPIYNVIKSAEKQRKIDRTLADLKQLLKDVPFEIREDGLALQRKLADYKVPGPELIELTGHVMSGEEVLAAVIEGTGINCWKIDNIEDEYGSGELFTSRGVKRPEKVSTYMLYRECRNRNDVYMLGVSALPGHIYMTYQTDRAGCDVDYIFPNEDLGKESNWCVEEG